MEDLSMDAIKRSLHILQDIVRCSICLETVRCDMIQCANLHLTCFECKGELTNCPVCREPFTLEKPSRLVTQMVEALPQRCKYRNCGKYLEPGSDHENYCGFNETTCEITYCVWKGPGKCLLEHITDQHPTFPVFTETALIQDSYPHILPAFDPYKESRYVSAYVLYQNLFWVIFYNDPLEEIFKITFWFVPHGRKPKEDIFVKFFLNSASQEFAFKIKLDFDIQKENCISNPWSILPDFINNGNLVYSLYITTL